MSIDCDNPKGFSGRMMLIGKLHRGIIDRLLSAEGIFWGQPPIIGYLMDCGSCIQNDLAEAVHIKPSSVTQILGTLEQAGVIQKRRSEDDKRIQIVSLTELGRQKAAVIERIFASADALIEDGLGADVAELERLLDKVIETLKNQSDCGGSLC